MQTKSKSEINATQTADHISNTLSTIGMIMSQYDLHKVELTLLTGEAFLCEKVPPVVYSAAPTACQPKIDAIPVEVKSDLIEIKSDMVGTIYLAPSPSDAPYISIGSQIKEGQTIFIIDAMKVMNHFKSPRAGTVKEILVQNEQVVEYGQVLVRIA